MFGQRAAVFAITLLAFSSPAGAIEPAERDEFIQRYCADCHDADVQKGGLDLISLLPATPAEHAEAWETVVRRLVSRQMPPKGKKARPSEESYERMLAEITQQLDQQPIDVGRPPAFRRLTRYEYKNAIRDLIGIEIEPAKWLPKDQSSHGFDNITVADLSPTLLSRYVTAAQEISKLAFGRSSKPDGRTVRIRPDLTQESHVKGLPLGTRGGVLIDHYFPKTGEYEVEVRLARDRNEEVEGLSGREHHLEVLLDRKPTASFVIRPVRKKDHSKVDAHLKARVQVASGNHKLGVTFLRQATSLIGTKRQPYESHFNRHRHPRLGPAVFQVSITGPYHPDQSAEENPHLIPRYPKGEAEFEACAEVALAQLMRRAFRRPISAEELERPLVFFREGAQEAGFDAGMELALSSILISSNFLFRVERDPSDLAPNLPYELTDAELASRLSFFLWSSLPDERLIDLAEQGNLKGEAKLEAEAERMLADSRSDSLVSNFASQWLHLRNLDSITPDPRLFADFDDNLRQAMRRETELLFESTLRENLRIVNLLAPRYLHLNERLAKHYGIPHIYGSRFRRVDRGSVSQRGGLLRHGSILTVTSYATRTSPVLRGNWILENLLGTPPPPPPPNVEALADNTVSAQLSVRERVAEHRANAQCAACHDLMDPIGLALENFDAVGRWRMLEGEAPIDASGGLPDGREFVGVDGLEEGLAARPEVFATALAEKLLTYALGRGVEHGDGPAVREIVRNARENEYRLKALIVGVVKSKPFRMRMSAP